MIHLVRRALHSPTGQGPRLPASADNIRMRLRNHVATQGPLHTPGCPACLELVRQIELAESLERGGQLSPECDTDSVRRTR